MSEDVEVGKAGPLFEDFLREQGNYEETTEQAVKRVIAYQLAEAIKFLGRGLLGFLNKAMQQNHIPRMRTKEYAPNPASRQIGPDFPKTLMVPDRPAKRHTDRPTKLRRTDIVANGFPVFRLQRQQPFPNRQSSCLGLEKTGRQALARLHS